MPFNRQPHPQLLDKQSFQLTEGMRGIFKYLQRDDPLAHHTRIFLSSQFCARVSESLELVYFAYLVSSTGKHAFNLEYTKIAKTMPLVPFRKFKKLQYPFLPIRSYYNITFLFSLKGDQRAAPRHVELPFQIGPYLKVSRDISKFCFFLWNWG